MTVRCSWHLPYVRIFYRICILPEILIRRNGSATFKGKLTTNKLTVKSIKVAGTVDPTVGTILPLQHKKMEGITRIQNLEVKSINGIGWNDFYGSLYLKGSPQPIEGNMRFGFTFLLIIISNSLRQFNHLETQSDQTLGS